MHSVKIYYAIKDNISTLPAIYICADGYDLGLLKHYLKLLLNIHYHEEKIIILRSLKTLFSKKNIADRLAYDVNKKGKKPSFALKKKHFITLKLI